MNNEAEQILQMIKSEFLPSLQKLFGSNLKSVLLYGSAARGNFRKGISDVNILVLTETPDPESIMQLGKSASRIIRNKKLSLHFLTEKEFQNSSDVFPMEYYDIKQAHVLLWGEDTLSGLILTPENLRHQVEERLRGSVNALRQAMLASQGRDKLLAGVLSEWYGSQTALFRGILRLLNREEIPEQPHELVQNVAQAFEIDPAGMEELISLREQKRSEKAAAVAVKVLGFLTALISKIDSMEQS